MYRFVEAQIYYRCNCMFRKTQLQQIILQISSFRYPFLRLKLFILTSELLASIHPCLLIPLTQTFTQAQERTNKSATGVMVICFDHEDYHNNLALILFFDIVLLSFETCIKDTDD